MEEKKLEKVNIENELFFKIAHCDLMRPFFMTIVSDANLWMFISSNGGITAGRQNASFSLFPYYSDDKITDSVEYTGSKTIFQIHESNKVHLWEPLSIRCEGHYKTTRNLYKNSFGNKILFEEVNHDLGLTFRYQWNSSDTFGFVKKSKLINHSNKEMKISVLDGIQNVLPYGVDSDLQNASSNLVNAYKRSELDQDSGLGIFVLSAMIVDKPEPSEALKANVAWSSGLENPKYLLSSLQLNAFRQYQPIAAEVDVKAERGAYFVNADIFLPRKGEKKWILVADVNKNHASITSLIRLIKTRKNLLETVDKETANGTQCLRELVASSDGLQLSADVYRDAIHFSNTLFNIMRGGVFDYNYCIDKKDFFHYLFKANKGVFEQFKTASDSLPEKISLFQLRAFVCNSESIDLKRLSIEYLPLKFSRRHGDPSRPWNKFSINTKREDGSKMLDYEGNWRDIFQNWEALAHAYPEFIESMIFKFLNASTFDGYNPYRITKDGFDWETIDPDDPWSYIGYWGDHQIIYLLKLLELLENHNPDRLNEYFSEEIFAYAHVPYKIKSYSEILKNPKNSIEFDELTDAKIRKNRKALGADAALLRDKNGNLVRANLIEKILATLLAKLSNFIPEGGIWMNTQRPEWNDANNALVGQGVSMVTLYYLRRFLKHFEALFAREGERDIPISTELNKFFQRLCQTFENKRRKLKNRLSDRDRKLILDALGEAGSDYRVQIYKASFSGNKTRVSRSDLLDFIALCLEYVTHTIKANKRKDQLYHAYNLMDLTRDKKHVVISHLGEMLEGQVAILSSGYLSVEEALIILDQLKVSDLFRPDQNSFLLYPNKDLKGFLNRNVISEKDIKSSSLLLKLLADGDTRIVEKDINGDHHFNGNFKNANDLNAVLSGLRGSKYESLLNREKQLVLDIFEQVFNHKAYTGRSGTFFGYEGLGSIYWHMVSKLLLAVQETFFRAIELESPPEIIQRLKAHFYEIYEGIGVHKSPQKYGAFPTDPYSHTPLTKGAQQPGMTGQVKEDILIRYGELGVFVVEQKLTFKPFLLRSDDFLSKSKNFYYIDVFNEHRSIKVKRGMLCFTYCQVPIIYQVSDTYSVQVNFDDKRKKTFNDLTLDAKTSKELFRRTGKVLSVEVQIERSILS